MPWKQEISTWDMKTNCHIEHYKERKWVEFKLIHREMLSNHKDIMFHNGGEAHLQNKKRQVRNSNTMVLVTEN